MYALWLCVFRVRGEDVGTRRLCSACAATQRGAHEKLSSLSLWQGNAAKQPPALRFAHKLEQPLNPMCLSAVGRTEEEYQDRMRRTVGELSKWCIQHTTFVPRHNSARHCTAALHFNVPQNKMHTLEMPHRRCFGNRFTESQVVETLAGGRL